MKISSQLLTGITLVVLLAGCAARRPGSAEITLRYSAKGLEKCQFLGEVRGAEHMVGGVLAGIARRNARVRMINKAMRMGADTLYVEGRHFWWFGASAWGKAYRCEGDELPDH